ncbi:interleukin-10 receptor subunit beta-like isoform X1 [Salmo salar]|uniref:IFNGR2 n=1 Tax=Salmo salar TaxID=8030 RepID=A0A088N6K8_SALSA|nr:interleukin-10 receptor subunit beta-like isoform X1 [Salmo salar]AIN50150.1 IFNGR2 [Salmo salar]|eukprot:XP_014030052.1 PREDICTED: interleukin-10 receptor subunit beta-like isoform X1 [Salmo salar]
MLCLKDVLLFWTFCHVLRQAWSEDELSSPRDVRVGSAVRWSPATDSPGIKYTVQYWNSDSKKWLNVSGCVQTELTTCNEVSGLGCVMVQVLAQEGNRTSRSVEACSHADSCSPEFQLISKEGLLMVQMVKNNRLREDNAAHFEYNIQYGRDGEEVKQDLYTSTSFKTINGLDVGQRYCVQVRYFCYSKPFGTPSTQHCESIHESERTRKMKIVAIGVTVTILLGVLVVGLTLFIYRHHKKVKQFLQPPLRLPDHYFEYLSGVFPQQALSITTSPCEERHDLISIVCREEDLSDSCLIPESEREHDYDSPNGLDLLDHFE